MNNRISVATYGILFNGTGKYRDNLTFDVGVSCDGGTPVGVED